MFDNEKYNNDSNNEVTNASGQQEHNNTTPEETSNNNYDRYKPSGYSYYNYSNQNSYQQNTYGSYAGPQNDAHEKKEKKKNSRKTNSSLNKTAAAPKSAAKKLGFAAAFAAVVGLVAGSAFYAVNAVGNMFIYDTARSSQSAKIEQSSDSEGESNVDNILNDGAFEEKNETTASTTSGEKTVSAVAEECMPSVVTIATISVKEMQSFFGGSQKYEAEGAGTGVIVGENDTELLIATNNHVVNGATSLSVGFIDQTSVEAYVKGTDFDNDLAVVAVKLSDIPQETLNQISVIEIGNSDNLQLGDQVVAIGNALGYGQSVTSGYVSALGRDLELSDGGETFTSTDLIQTDAAINSGNSGGALLNMDGQLVGINEAKSGSVSGSASVEGMGYAIPIDKALPILNDLMSRPTRTPVDEDKAGYLGITCADVTDEIASSYNMPIGVCITGLVENGPCEQAGLKVGDVITEFGGYEISSYEELTSELTYYEAGTSVQVKYMRADDGTYVEGEATVVLGTADVLENNNINR